MKDLRKAEKHRILASHQEAPLEGFHQDITKSLECHRAQAEGQNKY